MIIYIYCIYSYYWLSINQGTFSRLKLYVCIVYTLDMSLDSSPVEDISTNRYKSRSVTMNDIFSNPAEEKLFDSCKW